MFVNFVAAKCRVGRVKMIRKFAHATILFLLIAFISAWLPFVGCFLGATCRDQGVETSKEK